jgi:protein TonB
LSVRLERSSGVRSLDDEALSLPKRASPLPRPPEEVKGDSIELVVPVEFFMS